MAGFVETGAQTESLIPVSPHRGGRGVKSQSMREGWHVASKQNMQPHTHVTSRHVASELGGVYGGGLKIT